MYDNAQDYLAALRATPLVLEGLLRGCTQDQAGGARRGDEGWSVTEVICHVRDVEECALERMQAMRDHDDPFLPAYDQDRWARDRQYAATDVREALTAFIRWRAQHIAALERLSPLQWDCTGRHEELHGITIRTQTVQIIAHDAIHAAQIAQQLGHRHS